MYVTSTPQKRSGLAIFQFAQLRFALTFTVFLLTSCVSGSPPYLSDNWTKQSSEIQGSTRDSATPRLQVFITYSGLISSHTALRLVDFNGQVIFWDPAGGYGRFDDDWRAQYGDLLQTTERSQDLIVTNPPDVSMFTTWRWTIHDTKVEIFEWDLSRSQATYLRNALLNGTNKDYKIQGFSTLTYPLFCTMATSDFLRQFGSPIIRLPKQYFFPHNLAKALYSQSPSNIRVLTRDGQKTVYTPHGPKSARQ